MEALCRTWRQLNPTRTILQTRLRQPPAAPAAPRRTYYYKPQRKEAFYDVEGVVTKDILLFRYEDVKKMRRQMAGVTVITGAWIYLGYTAYRLKSELKPYQAAEGLAERRWGPLLLDNVVRASFGVGLGRTLLAVLIKFSAPTPTMTIGHPLALLKNLPMFGIVEKSANVLTRLQASFCSGWACSATGRSGRPTRCGGWCCGRAASSSRSRRTA